MIKRYAMKVRPGAHPEGVGAGPHHGIRIAQLILKIVGCYDVLSVAISVPPPDFADKPEAALKSIPAPVRWLPPGERTLPKC
jgi:hypothetical protein